LLAIRHKFYGPKALARCMAPRNPRVQLSAIIDGGATSGDAFRHAERSRHCGLGKAAELCQQEMAKESERLLGLRDGCARPGSQAGRSLYQRLVEHRLPISNNEASPMSKANRC